LPASSYHIRCVVGPQMAASALKTRIAARLGVLPQMAIF